MLNIISFIVLVISLTFHEFSHAFAADQLGDPTPRSRGRLTLNPLAHLDPLGTLMLLVAHFGWGKPVPIDPYNFRKPRRDEILVSLAGPASNIFLTIVATIFIRLTGTINVITYSIVAINISLAVFNLLPIPPLDGSKLLLNLLPERAAIEWEAAFSRYGFLLIAALLFLPVGGSNVINLIISPVIQFALTVLLG